MRAGRDAGTQQGCMQGGSGCKEGAGFARSKSTSQRQPTMTAISRPVHLSQAESTAHSTCSARARDVASTQSSPGGAGCRPTQCAGAYHTHFTQAQTREGTQTTAPSPTRHLKPSCEAPAPPTVALVHGWQGACVLGVSTHCKGRAATAAAPNSGPPRFLSPHQPASPAPQAEANSVADPAPAHAWDILLATKKSPS